MYNRGVEVLTMTSTPLLYIIYNVQQGGGGHCEDLHPPIVHLFHVQNVRKQDLGTPLDTFLVGGDRFIILKAEHQSARLDPSTCFQNLTECGFDWFV